MTSPKTRDSDWITRAEAAEILGISVGRVARLIRDGYLAQADRPTRRLSKAEVKTLIDDEMVWVNTRQAAEILGVNRQRVDQLVDKGFLPHEQGSNGRRRYRRAQVVVIANARRARWRTSPWPHRMRSEIWRVAGPGVRPLGARPCARQQRTMRPCLCERDRAESLTQNDLEGATDGSISRA